MLRAMFRLLGFEVTVRAGFVIFLGLIVFLYQDAFGLWLAASLAVFTLLHELGHAVAARRAGADASISLDFLAGYTSYRPRRPISVLRRALISAAGPVSQIVVSLAVVYALGADPFSIDSVRQSDLTAAVWWAGPVIGALNLIPVLPLDGGHLAQAGLEAVIHDRAPRVMAIASLVLTAGGAAVMFATGNGGFVIFIVFLLVNQFSLLQSTSGRRTNRSARPVDRMLAAEANAWQTGRPAMLEPGQRLSPWFEAHRALARGDRGGAMGVILADLRADGPPVWAPPLAAAPAQLAAIVDALPAELPVGNPHSSRVLADVLLTTGDVQRAGEYAARVFIQYRSSPLAAIVARAAARMGETTTALQWLRAAVDATADEPAVAVALLAQTMDQARELRTLRSDPAFRALRASLPA